MTTVTDPTKISVNGPTLAAPLQSVLSFLRNWMSGAVAWTTPGAIGGTTPNTGKFTTLTLTTAVATPAAGGIGAGDADWIIVGSTGGAKDPGYINSWTPEGGAFLSLRFRKLPTGYVVVEGSIKGGANGSQATGAWPVGYRPSATIQFIGSSGLTLGAGGFTFTSGGILTAFYSDSGTIRICGGFYADQ